MKGSSYAIVLSLKHTKLNWKIYRAPKQTAISKLENLQTHAS